MGVGALRKSVRPVASWAGYQRVVEAGVEHGLVERGVQLAEPAAQGHVGIEAL